MWWNGLAWLTSPNSRPENNQDLNVDLPEMKRITVALTVGFSDNLLCKFSSFANLCRVVAYCRRFVENCKLRQTKKVVLLEEEELRQAEKIVLRWIQAQAFSQLLKCLSDQKDLPRKGLLKSLSSFLDNDGLLKVGGRIRFSDASEEQKHPVLLPANHHITTCFLREKHERLVHCPPEQLLHAVREKYWPVHGRRETNKIIYKCVKCFNFKPRIPEMRMSDLPCERVTPAHRPFVITGVDYAGPISVREEKVTEEEECQFTKVTWQFSFVFTPRQYTWS